MAVTVRVRSRCLRRLRRLVEPARAGEVCWDAAPSDDGWVSLALPFEKLEYAQASLLGLGADVEVLEPAELRGQMVAAAAALGALYARG